ncbi:hypothetical protein [Bacillus cereus]
MTSEQFFIIFQEIHSRNNPDYANQLLTEKVWAVSEDEQTVSRTPTD